MICMRLKYFSGLCHLLKDHLTDLLVLLDDLDDDFQHAPSKSVRNLSTSYLGQVAHDGRNRQLLLRNIELCHELKQDLVRSVCTQLPVGHDHVGFETLDDETCRIEILASMDLVSSATLTEETNQSAELFEVTAKNQDFFHSFPTFRLVPVAERI
ncbi:MAG: hypothetical protein UT32_C0008G0023 [Parcubacteria group bacterium GW2011_GWC2_39_14]|nr:MAG: hypothetical protein UT32_C0008G0023 [Parcubacteria group bacterium GW2011_GWC2_39_14]KKR54912.1 MAG: hypothetical protein UT91_C0007G0013 [Parcubacteria group bacterium GW2011_GWA2_40_23]